MGPAIERELDPVTEKNLEASLCPLCVRSLNTEPTEDLSALRVELLPAAENTEKSIPGIHSANAGVATTVFYLSWALHFRDSSWLCGPSE